MALAGNSPVFGRPLKVLKQSVNNCSEGDVIAGGYGPLLSTCRKFVFFAKFQNLTTTFFAAVLSILPLCQSSVSLVSTQITEPCYESIKTTDFHLYCSVLLRCRLRPGIPKLLWPCTPASFRYMNMYP